MRLPTYKELRRFVEVEGWQDKDEKSHKKKGDHYRYVFTTPTGERLFTFISHGSDQIGDSDLFRHILRDQLCIDEVQFWNAVDKRIRPTRLSHSPREQTGAIDSKLARNLIIKVGLKPEQMVGLTQEKAQGIWEKWLATNYL